MAGANLAGQQPALSIFEKSANLMRDTPGIVGGTIANGIGKAIAYGTKREELAEAAGNQMYGPSYDQVMQSFRDEDPNNPRNFVAQPQEVQPVNASTYGALNLPTQYATVVPPTSEAPVAAQDKALAAKSGALAVVKQGQQKMADAVAKGYVAPPDVQKSPEAALAAMNGNRQKGLGDATGHIDIPTPATPTSQQQEGIGLQQVGQESAAEQNQIPVWYESTSFNMGLLTFGLNLLSGNDLAQSFSLASQEFTKGYGAEKRQAWAKDLAKQGYAQSEIEEYVRTGKSGVLTDPMERQAKALGMQLNQQQLNNMQYENSPEARQRAIDKDQFGMDIQLKQLQASQASAAASAANARESMAMRREENALRRQDRQDALALKGEKHQEGLEKAKAWSIRANQGLSNYQGVSGRVGGSGDAYSKNPAGKLYDAATIEGMFSGDQVKETIAKQANPKLAELISAEREFIAPHLRRDSGAAISASEWKTTGDIYFPRPGDTPERIAQKEQSRNLATIALDPTPSPEVKRAIEMYTNGQFKELKITPDKQIYAFDGKGWVNIPR